ncbi:transposase [Spirosoma aureum]|uniref:Transposase n=1 Tax=Spirosoma aureum TaxID=2692134 RepID=A0A6G9AW47_9BACT|nr:transposase [Spirosoma aureum]QIP16549.1 transposase [Spirosoma aureum]
MNQSQRPKWKYTDEFKADVLRLVANGEPIMAVARKMGISDSLIHAWRKANDNRSAEAGEKKTDQNLQQEVDSLRKQLRQSEMEREILKKAVAIFSRQT